MKYLALFCVIFSFYGAYGAINGPPAASQEFLDDTIHRVAHFGLIMNYMRDQALFDIVEHYSYLQNRDKGNLHLTKRQRADLQKYIDRYYHILRAINYQRPLHVTCQPPAQQ